MVVHRTHVHDLGVVHRHVDHARLRGHDADLIGLVLDALFVGRLQVALRARHAPQALHRGHHIARLHRVRLPERDGPVGTVGEQVEHRRVVRDRTHAQVPRLFVETARAVGAHVAVGERDLIGIRRRDQELREDRVRIERDRREQVVELLDRVQLARA